MRLVYGISVIVAELINNLLDLIMISFEDGIPNYLLKSSQGPVVSSRLLEISSGREYQCGVLQSPLLPLIVEFVIQQALDGLVHCSNEDWDCDEPRALCVY